MKMTIDEIIKYLPAPMCSGSTIIYPEEQKYYEAHDTAVNILQKYQKIEDIYYHQSGKTLENSLRAVIEDGNVY